MALLERFGTNARLTTRNSRSIFGRTGCQSESYHSIPDLHRSCYAAQEPLPTLYSSYDVEVLIIPVSDQKAVR